MEQQIEIEPEDQSNEDDKNDGEDEEMEIPEGIEDDAPHLDENGDVIEGEYDDENDEDMMLEVDENQLRALVIQYQQQMQG